MKWAFQSESVAAVYAAFPAPARQALLQIRDWIFEECAADAGIGQLCERLKWGQPSYLTETPKSGTTLRLWAPAAGGFGVYVPCSTTLIAEFSEQFGDGFRYDGARGVLFDDGASVDEAPIRILIRRAMRYHLTGA